jgi:hypothetical protein
MKLYQSLALVFGVSICCGGLGAVLGYSFGRFFPGYYYSMYPRLMQLGIDMADLGAGNGLQLGIVLGVVITTLHIAIQVWREKGSASGEMEALRQEIQELRTRLATLQAGQEAPVVRASESHQFRSAES